MTDPARAQTVDTEIAKHCAYSLPGVALTLGRQNWHCLKDTYETLASDVQVKKKKTKNTTTKTPKPTIKKSYSFLMIKHNFEILVAFVQFASLKL